MALPAHVDTLDDLPEAIREHYTEIEAGGFRLDTDGAEDVSGLKSALEKERDRRRSLKSELDELRRLAEMAPTSEAQVSEALTSEALTSEEETPEEELRAPAVELAGDPVSEIAPEVPLELTPEPTPDPDPDPDPDLDPPADADTFADPTPEDLATLRQTLETRLIEAEARSAILAARGVPELLLPIVAPRLALAEDEHGYAVRGRDPGPDGSPASAADLVAALAIDPIYARAFEASGRTGSGTPTTAPGATGHATISASDATALGDHVFDIATGRVRVGE